MNKALEQLQELLDVAVSFQNRFEQFKDVVGSEELFTQSLEKDPNYKWMWLNLCQLSEKMAHLGNQKLVRKDEK